MTSQLSSTGSGPCAGIRIVDMSSMMAGPFCTQAFADLGAEVIRVESGGSDPMRAKYPLHKGMSAMFEQMNRGKKSLCVDVKSEEGRKLIYELVACSDMFLQNSRPGVMERLGFGYETLRERKEDLIYVSVSGFGEEGPFARRPAYDMVIQGLTGFMPIQGAQNQPAPIRTTLADRITAMWAANAALAALLHRERTGEGQKVSVDMTSAYAASVILDQMQHHTFGAADLGSVDLSLGSYRTLETADGSVIGMVLQPAQLERFCSSLGCADLIDDDRFKDAMSILKNTDILYDRVADRVRQMTTSQFVDLMNEINVPFGRVNSVAEFIKSDEAFHSKVFVDFEDPDLGPIKHMNYPAKFGRSPANSAHRAPKLGENNEEIRKLLAGKRA